ncbi:unnamed protein product [Eruca vesicaria subsp. sativa]|uniref:Zinc finger A20 and AN1 domain-containing stress-associated protein 3 n=1 Tax=Eruca vesicaria subsp. sativa TaxID=29727 RepID=A0ABC8JS98_ERUVS|nr:unnamed protein product [Eruca vesicaria subsp. sativa]
MSEEHRLQEPRLCANDCGFFGNTATQNLCSKCFTDLKHEKENSSTAKNALKQTLAAVSTGCVASSSLSSPPPPADLTSDLKEVNTKNPEKRSATKPEEEQKPAQQDPKRCLTCRRRVGITGFRCRCGFVFCGSHRYAEQHECTFDFKRVGKEKIAKANPIVKAEKLKKI